MGGAAWASARAFYYEKLAGAAVPRRPWRCCIAVVRRLPGRARWPALLFSFLTITLRANQNVTGLALTIFGTGAGQYLGEYMRVQEGTYVALSNTLKAAFDELPLPRLPPAACPCSARCSSSHSILHLSGHRPGSWPWALHGS